MNQLWGYLIIEELVRNGVDYFVISPGSRSTPLTVAVAQNSQAKKIICLDLKILLSIALGKGIELIPVLVHKNLLQHNTYAQFYF